MTTSEMLAVYAQHIMHMQVLLERAANVLTDSERYYPERKLGYEIDDYLRASRPRTKSDTAQPAATS